MLNPLVGIAIASVFHVFEEFVYPGGFLQWVRRWSALGAPTVGQAVVLNAVFVGSVYMIAFTSPQTTPVLSLSIPVLVLANGALHILGTFVTRTYSPGVATSVLLYFPLASFGLMTLPAKWHMNAHQVVLSILLGIGWQLVPAMCVILFRRAVQ